MRYSVNSAELLNILQILDKVILTKNVSPIQACALFEVKDNMLNMRSTDKEITITCSIELIDASGECRIAINTKRIIEILRTIPEQPITFDINTTTQQITLSYQNGHMTFQGENADEFPSIKPIEGDITSFGVPAKALSQALGNALIGTAAEEARQNMKGVFFDLTPEYFAVVASDGRKLVRTLIDTSTNGLSTSFILPQKPINVMRSILEKLDSEVRVSTTATGNASFEFGNYVMYCRLVDENYPNYRRVIPQNNECTATIDRDSLVNALRRIIAIADKTTCLIKLQLDSDKMTLSAEDSSYSQSAEEQIMCQYDSMPIKIGFQGNFLYDLANRLTSDEIIIKLSDPSRAGLIIPSEQQEGTQVLMLLMPLLITN